MRLDCAGKWLDLTQPLVMGVINVTPDSFSDGGRFLRLDDALQRAEVMVADGAALIDVGGESTRPGASVVSVQEELDRVLPLVERLARELPIPISVDTSKPQVMRAAVGVGAGLINDIWALRLPGALEVAVAGGVPVCLMHMRGEPGTMQQNPDYGDVVGEVKEFLRERIQACEAAGLSRQRILVDPGFGFGKALVHNLSLLRHINCLTDLSAGVLVGVSRKSMVGALLNVPVDQRLSGSLAAAVVAVWQGARIIRAHDVGETVQALRVCAATLDAP